MSLLLFIDPAYLKQQLDRLTNLNLSLTDLRDAIIGPDGRTLTDIYNKLGSIGGTVSVGNFPTWFTSSTKLTDDIYDQLTKLTNALASVGTDKLRVSPVDPVNVGNFPSWFTNSTKLTDDLYSKLDALSRALASVGGDSLMTQIVAALPSGDNWIGRIKVGDGTNVVSVVSGTLFGSSRYLLGVAPDMTATFAGGTNYTEQVVNVTTTEATSSFSPPLKMVNLCNQGDADINYRLNGGTTVKVLPARTCKAVALWPVSSISYSVASGSSVLRIEGYW